MNDINIKDWIAMWGYWKIPYYTILLMEGGLRDRDDVLQYTILVYKILNDEKEWNTQEVEKTSEIFQCNITLSCLIMLISWYKYCRELASPTWLLTCVGSNNMAWYILNRICSHFCGYEYDGMYPLDIVGGMWNKLPFLFIIRSNWLISL